MATGTKQQWRKLSQQMREHTTPHELGEAVLALSQGKRAASSKTDYRIWVAVIIGAVFMLSIGVSREVTNSRALAAQVEEITEAHAEAAEQARIAEEERVKAEKLSESVRALSSRYLKRTREELLRMREEPPDNVPGEPFAAMRFAGELLRQGGIEDVEFWDQYADATNEVLTRLAQYLNPEIDVAKVVIVESKDGQP